MITITPNQLGNYWFYSLSNAQGNIVFLGCERFPEIFTLASVLKLPGVPMDEPLTITLYSAHKRHMDAQNARSAYIRNELAGRTPVYNMAQGAMRHNGLIRCDQTGLTYRTQLEAAAALGISQGQLSKHLQRAPGYNSVKGFTFSYVNARQESERVVMSTAKPESLPDLSALDDQQRAWWHVINKIPADARTAEQARYWEYLQSLCNAA